MTIPGIPKQWSGDEVLLTVLGVSITEFAPGTFVTISLEGDDTAALQGHNGAIIVSDLPNGIATITFMVMYGSADNDALSAAVAAGGVGLFAYQDLNGLTIVSAPASKIKKRPDIKGVTEGEPVEWVCWVLGVGKWNAGSNLPLV